MRSLHQTVFSFYLSLNVLDPSAEKHGLAGSYRGSRRSQHDRITFGRDGSKE